MWSQYRCDTDSGGQSRRIEEDVERTGGEVWERLEETAKKVEAGEQQSSAGTSSSGCECISKRPGETSLVIGLTHLDS